MWNPFKKAKEEKARADKLQNQLQDLLEREQKREEEELAERRAVEAALEEAREQERLIEEEKKRKEAAKTLATENKQPYFDVVSVDMDEDTGTVGAFEMDWNVHFIEMLQKNGYYGVSDEDAVDQWFRSVCKHVVLETYENADEGQTIQREDLGDGRAGYS